MPSQSHSCLELLSPPQEGQMGDGAAAFLHSPLEIHIPSKFKETTNCPGDNLCPCLLIDVFVGGLLGWTDL